MEARQKQLEDEAKKEKAQNSVNIFSRKFFIVFFFIFFYFIENVGNLRDAS